MTDIGFAFPAGNAEGTCRMSHAGIRYTVETGGFVEQAVSALGLARLGRVRQLQFLTALPVSENTPYYSAPHTFPHNRLEHSLGVGAIMQAMLARNGIGAPESFVPILGAVIHDGMTPAGGDAIKYMDLQLFDEDLHIRELFLRQTATWVGLRRRFGLRGMSQIAEDMMNGRGLWGHMLDIADTCSYLDADSRELSAACARLKWDHIPGYHHEILSLASQEPCRVWEDVEIVGEYPVVRNPDRLYRFLRLRALLWHYLYNAPAAKALERLLVVIVLPELLRQRKIDRARLIAWGDDNLHAVLEKTTRIKGIASTLNIFGAPPRRQSFRTQDEAMAREAELAREDGMTLVFDASDWRINPKTDKYFVLSRAGRPATFAGAYPAEAEEIARQCAIAEAETPLHVVRFPLGPGKSISRWLSNAWHRARRRWRMFE